MDAPRLGVDDLVLDAPRLEDAADWSDAQDDECARWFDWPCRPGLERCTEHLRRLTADTDADERSDGEGRTTVHEYTWAIRTQGRFAGSIDLKLHEGAWNVSYFVHPDLRGHGIATRALCCVRDWAFGALDLQAIGTRVHVDNIASRHVLEAAGFRCVGEEASTEAGHLDLLYRCVAGDVASGAA